MPPPESQPQGSQEEHQRIGRREPTFLRPDEWPTAGAFLEQAFIDSGLSKRSLLATIRYEGGTNRLNSWFRGDPLATPETLAKICPPLKLSYLETIDRFGYYRELLRIFDDLVQLGDRWRDDDQAFGQLLRPGPDPKTLRDSGVVYWHGHVITWGYERAGIEPFDPRDDPTFEKRYTIGEWREGMPRMSRNIPSIVRDAVRATRSTAVVVAKPTAVAILLAVLAFSRRGDSQRTGADEYRIDLARAADALVKASRVSRAGRPRYLHSLLQRAMDTLDDSSIPFNSRRPIAAEYIIAWAESICEPYTRFARLAAFDFWGEAGARTPTSSAQVDAIPGETTSVTITPPTIYMQMPQLFEATLPEIEPLTTYY
jgi:hypothetical protein